MVKKFVFSSLIFFLLSVCISHPQSFLGKTSLHWAAENGLVKIVEILLETNSDIDSLDYFENTPLHAGVDHPRIVE